MIDQLSTQPPAATTTKDRPANDSMNSDERRRLRGAFTGWVAGATHLHAAAAGVVAAIVTYLFANGRKPPYNNYDLLADAFNHGHVWIKFPGDYIDALPYNGQHFIIEGPMPGVLSMPFVALFGANWDQLFLGMILVGIGVAACWKVCERLGLTPFKSLALTAFFFAGTDLLWCAMLSDVWDMAHVGAATFTMLALAELLGPRRAWLVGIWAVCAFESRFSMALAIPVYLYLLLTDSDRPLRLSPRYLPRLLQFAGVGVVTFGLWVAYNKARWGTFADIGYTKWYQRDQLGSPTGSPFQLRFLQHQLYSFFIQGPQLHPGYPWANPATSGQALIWTSPALVLAFWARRPTRLVVAMWFGVAAGAVTNLVYYVNGFNQFGMRHALDFEPFLLVLMGIAVRRRFPRWGYVLVIISILVGLWGCWYWDRYYV
ncbi:hypothetical protein SAMN05892883_2505 [Jatrophihabitans sp. GAS493]|uniref:hypothetical protein n=1 Tax=Jatrophihabitans sp. GAS493 TaxID=1907575 RepID=UPI000BB8E827|nr:hypothetical protein [Jatrophihabitans sp. GAS493]SOD73214.1 hypothetical protein SAMN05892883_2505 [Jatrophihabitans sp. GAS493]